jgi:hypothetical protein
MKKMFFLIAAWLFCMPLVSRAQADDGKGMFVELNIGHAHTYYHDDDGVYTILSPRLGYQFNDRWSAGIKYIGEINNDLQYHTGGIYAQYNFWQKNRFKTFVEGAFTLGVAEEGLDGGNDDGTDLEAGFSFGASYTLSNHFNLLLRYLYVGFSHSVRVHQKACWGDHNFILDANLSRLQIGVQYIF